MYVQEIAATAEAGRPPPSNMTVEDFRRIGESLYGSLWKDDLVQSAGIAKSLITRILNRTRPILDNLPEQMRNAAIARIADIARVLVMDGMPETHSERTKEWSAC